MGQENDDVPDRLSYSKHVSPSDLFCALATWICRDQDLHSDPSSVSITIYFELFPEQVQSRHVFLMIVVENTGWLEDNVDPDKSSASKHSLYRYMRLSGTCPWKSTSIATTSSEKSRSSVPSCFLTSILKITSSVLGGTRSSTEIGRSICYTQSTDAAAGAKSPLVVVAS